MTADGSLGNSAFYSVFNMLDCVRRGITQAKYSFCKMSAALFNKLMHFLYHLYVWCLNVHCSVLVIYSRNDFERHK